MNINTLKHPAVRIIFTLLYKQVYHEYIGMENVPPHIAVQLAVLELRRKYPNISAKGS